MARRPEPALLVEVPLWLARWGLQEALIAAPTHQQAKAIAKLRNEQAHGEHARRWAVVVNPATTRDVEAFAEAGLLPTWCADLATATPDPIHAEQEALAL